MIYYMTLHVTWHSGKDKSMETVRRSMVAKRQNGGRGEKAKYRVFLGQ